MWIENGDNSISHVSHHQDGELLIRRFQPGDISAESTNKETWKDSFLYWSYHHNNESSRRVRQWSRPFWVSFPICDVQHSFQKEPFSLSFFFFNLLPTRYPKSNQLIVFEIGHKREFCIHRISVYKKLSYKGWEGLSVTTFYFLVTLIVIPLENH